MASKHFVLRIHTEPQKPHKGDKGHDNSCHTYHAYVYICLCPCLYACVGCPPCGHPSCFLALRWGHDSCHLAARAVQSKLSAQRRLRINGFYESFFAITSIKINDAQGLTLYFLETLSPSLMASQSLEQDSTEFGFSWGTVAQVSLSYKWPVTVRMSSGTTKGSWIACQPFISLYIPHNFGLSRFLQTNTHPSTCVLWHHMLHIFPTLPDGAVWLIRGQYITIP